MSSEPDTSRSPAPLHGLLGLLLAGILWHLAVGAVHSTRYSTGERSPSRHACIYQVYRSGVCQGTLFAHSPMSLTEILYAAGMRSRHTEPSFQGEIPCNRAVTLHDSPPRVTVGTMSGAHILIAGGKIDLNAASPSDLRAVPGIGDQLAHAVVSHRDVHGSFRSLHALTAIQGIGRRKLEALSQYLTTQPLTGGQSASTHQSRDDSP